jgi:hypothetical protein
MISVHIMGGLGNQLFQIFAAFSYALDVNQEFVLPNIGKTPGITERPTYWSSFLSSLQFLVKDSLPKIEVLREKGFEYYNIPKIFGKDILFYGYFQSYKYFENYYKEICDIIELEKKKLEVKEKFNKYNFENSVSMHFRIGDYIHIQNTHPILEESYYEKSLNKILENVSDLKKVYYFTEKQDYYEVQNIIFNLAKIFPELEFINILDETKDWEEMLLMSMCENNIIANSTFSWWGAYFNNNPDKIVCYPSIWFGPRLKHNTEDLFPPSWTKISE